MGEEMTEDELKQQLAAARITVAQLREEVEGIQIRLTKAHDYLLDGKDFEAQIQVGSAKRELKQALSAAPKRGQHPKGETKKVGKKLIVSTGPAKEEDFEAGPKRGRVLWEDEATVQHESDNKGDPITIFLIDRNKGDFWLDEHHGNNDQSVTVTVREAELPTGPIDCPMCGVAGGDELGPCSMCKGAGFVEAE